MTQAILIAYLLGTTWNTYCTMNQTANQQGFTVDQVVFADSSHPNQIQMIRNWYSDHACTQAQGSPVVENGTYSIGTPLTEAFMNSGESIFEADWNLNNRNELAAIAISADQNEIRISRNPGWSGRNTMISFIGYYLQKPAQPTTPVVGPTF